MTDDRTHGPVAAGLLLALLLSAGYWAHPSRRNEAMRVAYNFYAPLMRQGMSLDGSYVVRHLDSGEYTEWTYMLARAALVRWRLAGVAPNALTRLEDRWTEGFWSPPDRQALATALARLDSSWSARRAAAGDPIGNDIGSLSAENWQFTANSGSNQVEIGPDSARTWMNSAPSATVTLRVRPPDLPTAWLGNRLILTVRTEGRLDPDRPATLYWSTQELGESGLRRRIGRARATDGADWEIAFDLMDEPGWLHPEARVAMLRFDLHLANPGRVGIVGLRGADALPPSGGIAVGDS